MEDGASAWDPPEGYQSPVRGGGTSRGGGAGSSWDSPVLDSARRKYEIERRGSGGAGLLALGGLLTFGGIVYAFSKR